MGGLEIYHNICKEKMMGPLCFRQYLYSSILHMQHIFYVQVFSIFGGMVSLSESRVSVYCTAVNTLEVKFVICDIGLYK